MNIFFDTEFIENGETIDLISIGMVREDGKTYYAELAGFDESKANDFVKENVLPKLGPKEDRKDKEQVKKEIVAFVGENPVFAAYYGAYDWVALCQLFGTMMDLPEGWPKFCYDIKQKIFELGNPDLPEQDKKGGHNALADTKWLFSVYQWLQKTYDFKMPSVPAKKSEGMVAVKYQVFFFDEKADRKDQIMAIEPAFNSPGAVDSLVRASKFEGKDHLVLIGSQEQIDELMKEVERLDLTDWMDASITERKESLKARAVDLGMSVNEKLREQQEEMLVLGDDPVSITAAKKWKYPRPVQLPSGHEVIWDTVGNATKIKDELMKQASSQEAYALHVIVYEDACRRQNIIPWAFTSQTDLADHALRLRTEIEQRENIAASILNRIEKHLLGQNFITKAQKQSLESFQLNPSHGHYEISHKTNWLTDTPLPSSQNWKRIEGFILREMGMKYPFRTTKKGLMLEIANPGAADPMFKPALIPTRIEIEPENNLQVTVRVIQIITKHQAALMTQEKEEDRIHKTLFSMIKRWYSSKQKRFPDPPVRTYGKG